jgi:hypothetical protein
MVIRDSLPKDEDIKIVFKSDSAEEPIAGNFASTKKGRLLTESEYNFSWECIE